LLVWADIIRPFGCCVIGLVAEEVKVNIVVGRGLAPAVLLVMCRFYGGSKPPPYEVRVNRPFTVGADSISARFVCDNRS